MTPLLAVEDIARDSRSGSCPRTIVLIGQPNCGKSTIFNHVVGYRSETANFPGSTVEVAQGQVRLNGCITQLMDAPGIYSLTSSNPAEAAAKQFLLRSDVDLIINVLDACLLSRGLELTLELRELGMPMLVCLNMMDDAERKGISIPAERLSNRLGLPVLETVASRGQGIRELFAYAVTGKTGQSPDSPRWSRDVEDAVREIESALAVNHQESPLPSRFVAVKLPRGRR